MKLIPVICSLATVVMLSACEDLFEGGNLQPDGSTPSLTINTPDNNQDVVAAAGLRVNITAVDKDSVESINFTLQSEGAEKAVLNFTTTPVKKIVEFDTVLSVKDVAPGTYTLLVSATDKRTNLSTQEVTVNVE